MIEKPLLIISLIFNFWFLKKLLEKLLEEKTEEVRGKYASRDYTCKLQSQK